MTKKSPRKPNQRALRAFKDMVENGLTRSQAQRNQGYSEAYIISGKFVKTLTYIDQLNKVGLDDEVVAGLVKQMSFSQKHEQITFRDKVGVRKKRGSKKYETYYTQVSDEEINKIVAEMPGCRVVAIMRNGLDHSKVAYCVVPNDTARKDGLSFVHKSKGLFAAIKFEGDLTHTATDAEKAKVEAALNKVNGKTN